MAIHAVFGTDEGRVAEEAHALFEKLKPADGDEFANDIIEGVADDSEHAFRLSASTVEAIQTVGFFGGAKVVWLKGATYLGDDRTGGAERAKAGVENLLECLKAGVSPEVEVLISAPVIDKRRGFYKWLQKNAEVKIYDKIDVSKEGWEEEVAVLVQRRAKEMKLSFEDDALDLFVQLAGEDTRQIGNELTKMSLYLGDDATVSIDEVRVMIPPSRKGVIWEISRAIERGEAARAVELIDAQLDKGENAIGLMRAAIIPTVRNLFYARLALDAGAAPGYGFGKSLEKLPPEKRAVFPKKKDGGINAWGLSQAVGKVGKRNLSQMRKALEFCLKADKSLVTTSLDHRLVLHRLVVELTSL
ncbi:DNA polymerase III subunit delta [Roseibacillus persicicus]|uniref:DNA polymerase III subunit delta n=1 Tax=Roseibacillus persicicus TaxID=454148 RepID=UPI00280EBE47|nr:DNA polymerase III subunit delta [Roseibacillus persicicus]MDQ8190507.1 DNA polymerase III subunit delta [Roseibacillus persicicus]